MRTNRVLGLIIGVGGLSLGAAALATPGPGQDGVAASRTLATAVVHTAPHDHGHDHIGHDHGPLNRAASSEASADGPSASAARTSKVTVVASGTRLPSLRRGDAVFWNGGQVDDGQMQVAALCEVTGPCFSYGLTLAEGGHRLRVAIDTPSREDSFEIAIVASDGTLLGSAENSNMFNAEAFAAAPKAGKYMVTVRPIEATDASFRLRARLEAAPATASSKVVPLLPNLRTVPPVELGFVAPVTPNGSYPPDKANPPAEVLGTPLYSCTQDESAPAEAGGAGAVDCLRLTSGPMNVGAGPFDMRFTFADDLVDGSADPTLLRGPIFQAVHYSDGTTQMRAAGAYIFHTTHAHFHDENILSYDLYRVTDAKRGRLAPAGTGTKSGFCPADQLFGDWWTFDQQERGYFGEGDNPTGNCFSPSDGLLGLTSGWGDVYRWQRPGQYVEFAGNGDGLYVVRATVDKANHILESNETDNTSYTLIRIVGRSVDIIERGRGRSPWDGDKVVYTGDGPASIR